MPRRTLQDALDSRIPEAVNLPPGDTRVIQYLNEAQDKLWKRGHWWGSMARYNISLTAGLVTLPREIATIERVAYSNRILEVHDFWYEWLDNGWGPINESLPDGRATCEYRGRSPVFSQPLPPNKSLKIVCDLAVDAGKVALIQGYDDSLPPNWIRTQIGSTGTFQSGVPLTMVQSVSLLTAPSTDYTWSSITDLQLPTNMQGQCWLYEFDIATQINRLIGQYNANNPRPSFAQYFFPFVLPQSPQPIVVEALAKLEFIPVAQPSDYLMIGNLPALKLACMAIKAEEELRFSDASLLLNGGINPKTGYTVIGAIQELDFELDHYLGTGRRIGLNIQGFNKGEVEPVENVL